MDRFRIICLGLSLLLAGCGSDSRDDGIACTLSLEPGIVVVIRDALTDAPLAENAIVVITSNNYSETLTVYEQDGSDLSSAFSVAGAFERPGVYDINLSLSGYVGWSRIGVEVTSGICHVGTVRFTVRLETL
jgi:hypothetical protein